MERKIQNVFSKIKSQNKSYFTRRKTNTLFVKIKKAQKRGQIFVAINIA